MQISQFLHHLPTNAFDFVHDKTYLHIEIQVPYGQKGSAGGSTDGIMVQLQWGHCLTMLLFDVWKKKQNKESQLKKLTK